MRTRDADAMSISMNISMSTVTGMRRAQVRGMYMGRAAGMPLTGNLGIYTMKAALTAKREAVSPSTFSY